MAIHIEEVNGAWYNAVLCTVVTFSYLPAHAGGMVGGGGGVGGSVGIGVGFTTGGLQRNNK